MRQVTGSNLHGELMSYQIPPVPERIYNVVTVIFQPGLAVSCLCMTGVVKGYELLIPGVCNAPAIWGRWIYEF
jgi:hypothetical protein